MHNIKTTSRLAGTVVLLIILFSSARAEWNIQSPAKEIPDEMTGLIFGKKFTLGEATWTSSAITLHSRNKIGLWPESRVQIFISNETEQNNWWLTPDESPIADYLHVHMKFAKPGKTLPGSMVFSSEYSAFLKLEEVKGKVATFKIHLSLPDYKKSFLFGTFKAKITD